MCEMSKMGQNYRYNYEKYKQTMEMMKCVKIVWNVQNGSKSA